MQQRPVCFFFKVILMGLGITLGGMGGDLLPRYYEQWKSCGL